MVDYVSVNRGIVTEVIYPEGNIYRVTHVTPGGIFGTFGFCHKGVKSLLSCQHVFD